MKTPDTAAAAPLPAPKLNIYTCKDCGDHIVTKDLHEGATPFVIRCGKCGTGYMYSSFYRVWDLRMSPTHVWYKPDADELQQLAPGVKEHAEKGGLLLRKANDDEKQHWISETPQPLAPPTAQLLMPGQIPRPSFPNRELKAAMNAKSRLQ